MERLMLLDGFGLVYRGYYALPPLTTSKGELVNGVFGFCSIVLRGFADLKPDYVAVAFDLSGPTFRHEQYAEYKATRTRMPDDLAAQFPKVREVVKALRVPVYEQQGFEADDVIGALTVQAEAAGVETTIVTVDLDMLQLVTDRTRVMTTRSGVENTVIYDPARIWERYGLRPDQMIDYKALKGDPTDNIPGVPGVGEKTAAKLVAEFGDLDALYARIDEVKPEKLRDKLVEHREAVFRGRDLSTIVRELPVTLDLEAARLGDYDRDTVIRLFREYEFRTLIERLPAMSGESAVEKVQALREISASGTVAAARVGTERPAGWGSGRPIRAGSLGGDGLQLSLDFDTVSRPAREAGATTGAEGAGRGEPVRFDDLATALGATISDPGRIELIDADGVPALAGWLGTQSSVGASIVFDDPRPRRGIAQAFAIAGADGRVIAGMGEAAANALRLEVEGRGLPLVAHEAKPILVARFAVEPNAPATKVEFDTQIAAYILNAALRSQSIADVVAERLDLVLPPPKELEPVHRAGLEALSALAVRDPLARALQEESLERLFREIELPLIPVLARMEATGVAVDLDALAVLDREFGTEISRLEEEIYSAVGHQFTIGSPKQLGDILFEELRLPRGRRTKTGYSTDAAVLEELVGVHPVIQPVLDWRIYTKLRSTYVETLPSLIAEDGRLHTTFHQAVASTGRLSSSDPNLQNIPIRTPLGRRIRRAFVAGSADTVLVAADYSQIELRIIAHVSGDEHLKEAFAKQADIHRETAARVLHKPPDEITPDERSMAKMVNFGLAYGMSDFGLSSRAGISRQEAQEFINSYFAAYSGISYYMLHIKETARRQGHVTTLLGRKRSIPELHAANAALRGAGERMAINMPIQGTAADIQKIAMIRVDERSMAKMVNFGLAYGMSDFGLSSRAGISRQEAQEFINSYFAAYSGISYYMLHIKETARRQGHVTTLLGRKRSIPELHAANAALRGAGERMAINMPIQGTAADIQKIAMIRVADRLAADGFGARLLLSVHDELLLEVPRAEVERLIPVLREVMEGALPLDVPLTVDVKVGTDWESMTPVSRRDAILAEADEAPVDALAG